MRVDISTKPTLLCPPSYLQSTELNSMSLTWLLLTQLHLAILFIFDLTYTVSMKMNNIAKYSNFSNNGARAMISRLFCSRQYDEHNGVRFVEISITFTMQADCFAEMVLFGEYGSGVRPWECRLVYCWELHHVHLSTSHVTSGLTRREWHRGRAGSLQNSISHIWDYIRYITEMRWTSYEYT